MIRKMYEISQSNTCVHAMHSNTCQNAQRAAVRETPQAEGRQVGATKTEGDTLASNKGCDIDVACTYIIH